MRIYKKIVTPRGVVVGQACLTHDKKPGICVKKSKQNFYDIVSLEEIMKQVHESLGIDE